MLHHVEVAYKKQLTDPAGIAVMGDAKDLGIRGISDVRVTQLFVLDGDFTEKDAAHIAGEILSDPIINDFSIDKALPFQKDASHVVTVFRKPGVMDPVEASTKKAIRDIGLNARNVRTGKKFVIFGKVREKELELLAKKVLGNDVIEEVFFGDKRMEKVSIGKPYEFKLTHVQIRKASDDELMRISKQGQLSLNIEEMHAVRDYFTKERRDPTDVELETVAQTWSEHCKHKTFSGLIDYEGKVIDNLLKTTIMKATVELDKPWCLSVFKDNAGVIDFDEKNAVCFKVETHNHPSAIEPYGGAGTGIGGVIRDPLGCGLGAKPILNTDVFAFGPPDYPHEKLPKGVLHPKRIMKGVVAGVRDYGNRMGIPTENGAVFFDERYVGNPLVYCGTAGIMPKDKVEKETHKGDLVLLVGGRTGRDGIHGATFSSVELHEESETVSSGSVQIGNAIEEKKVLDTVLQARDKGLYSSITDCGGGGLSSAVGEMGADLGVEVDLDKVPLKYDGLSYTEIWISEAQERMLMSVPPENADEIMKIFAGENVDANFIGRFTGDHLLHLKYKGNTVAKMDMEFLHKGVPKLRRKAEWKPKTFEVPPRLKSKNFGKQLHGILSSWNVCSKEWIIRQYDHEVQAASVVKPLCGVANDGPSDACVVKPLKDSWRGIVVSSGMNPLYGDIDPYHMAASVIDEALRNSVAVGGDPNRTAILDNFSWGNTNWPDRLGGLVRAAYACYDTAKAYGTPFVSGKDSLNNEYITAEGTIVIPPSLLVSAISIIPDVRKAVTADLKAPGNLLYVVGLTKDEMGGSHFYKIRGFTGNDVPELNMTLGRAVLEAVYEATQAGLIRSCHDMSEGGLAVAMAEMAFAGGVGVQLDLAKVPKAACACEDEVILFSESNSRFIIEIEPRNREKFEALVKSRCHAVGLVGETVKPQTLTIKGCGGKTVVEESLAELKESWQKPLRW
jgi:phosphoribosylformylglycinamidine synthase II